MTEREEISRRKNRLIALRTAEKQRHKERMDDLSHKLKLVEKELELARSGITAQELRKLKEDLYNNRISMRMVSDKSGYSMATCRKVFMHSKEARSQKLQTKADVFQTARKLLEGSSANR